MAASLDPVRQKILWAAKHLDALEVEIIRYFDTDPAEVVTEDDFEAKTKWVTFKLRKPVPDPILFITGDVIQNLRSSLDYLVRELVIAANEQPTDKEVFPICDSPKGFNEAIRRGACGALVDVPGREAIAEIERLQ